MMHCTTLLQTWFKTHNTHTLYFVCNVSKCYLKKPQLRSETNVCLWIVVFLQSTQSFLLIWKHNGLIMGNKDFHYFLTNIPQNIRIKFVYLYKIFGLYCNAEVDSLNYWLRSKSLYEFWCKTGTEFLAISEMVLLYFCYFTVCTYALIDSHKIKTVINCEKLKTLYLTSNILLKSNS